MPSNYDSVVTAKPELGEDGVLKAGDTIKYNMDVANSGNTCLMGVKVMDYGMESIACDAWYPGEWSSTGKCSRRRWRYYWPACQRRCAYIVVVVRLHGFETEHRDRLHERLSFNMKEPRQEMFVGFKFVRVRYLKRRVCRHM